MINSIKGMLNKVEYALENYPQTRDNDSILIGHIFNSEVEIKRVSAFHLLDLMSKGVLPPVESITRARRKLQQLHPHLRGTSHKSRKNAAKEVKEEITQIG